MKKNYSKPMIKTMCVNTKNFMEKELSISANYDGDKTTAQPLPLDLF